MNDITFSVELVREYLRQSGGDQQERLQAIAAFEVVMETCEAMSEMLHAAIEEAHDAQMAMSALRHPSQTADELKTELRRLANLHTGSNARTRLFDQLLDELIAEARLEVTQPLLSVSSSAPGHGRAM